MSSMRLYLHQVTFDATERGKPRFLVDTGIGGSTRAYVPTGYVQNVLNNGHKKTPLSGLRHYLKYHKAAPLAALQHCLQRLYQAVTSIDGAKNPKIPIVLALEHYIETKERGLLELTV